MLDCLCDRREGQGKRQARRVVNKITCHMWAWHCNAGRVITRAPLPKLRSPLPRLSLHPLFSTRFRACTLARWSAQCSQCCDNVDDTTLPDDLTLFHLESSAPIRSLESLIDHARPQTTFFTVSSCAPASHPSGQTWTTLTDRSSSRYTCSPRLLVERQTRRNRTTTNFGLPANRHGVNQSLAR